MFWVVLIVLLIISALAVGLGIDFWALVGILIGLGVVAFLAIGAWATYDEKAKELAKNKSTSKDNKKEEKKMKFKANLGKIIAIGAALVLIVVIISGLFGSCDVAFGDDGYEEYDEVMGGYDWGDHYYYDSSDHEVKWTPWK